jgi:hypothetical protein
LRLYGSDAIKEKWLPGLATNKVSPSFTIRIILPHLAYLNCLEW